MQRTNLNRTIVAAMLAVALGGIGHDRLLAGEPGWSPVVLPMGDYRNQIKSMPIEHRPYRPLHIYGNTVRRLHYRSNSPQSRIFVPSEVRRGRPALRLIQR